MKWTFKAVLVVLGIIPLSRCSSGYKQKDGKVSFNGKELEGKGWIVLNGSFAKNDTTVYYKERAFEYADAATFQALDDNYAKDKDKVYYCYEHRTGQSYYTEKKQVIITAVHAIPASFVALTDGYARDEKQAYFCGVAFTVKEVASLSVIDSRFVKDHYQVYFEKKPIKNADPKSFRLLNSNYAIDTSRVYYYGYPGDLHNGIHEIPCHKRAFTLLDYPYSKDDKAAFYLYTKIKGADAVRFAVIGNGYATDGKHIYYHTNVVKQADIDTFKTYEDEENDEVDAVDARNKYNRGERVD